MKFSELLVEYLDIRDEEKEENYYNKPINTRWRDTERKRQLLDEMDEMFRSLEERMSYTGNE